MTPVPLQNGSVLVGLLWCLALLSVIVISVLHTARMDLLVVKNYGDRIQAHYLALAGIEKAEALLYRDAGDRSRSQKNHTGNLYDDAQQFRDVPLGRGVFRVFRRSRPDEGGGIIFGVSDEESRLNVNTATADELAKLQNMTPDVAAAIVNWRGGDSTTVAAEAQYYAGLKPPYQPRIGPFQTVRELLMVRGVTPELLLGSDVHQNGLLEAAGENGSDFAFDNSVENSDLGWAGILTVDSSVQKCERRRRRSRQHPDGGPKFAHRCPRHHAANCPGDCRVSRAASVPKHRRFAGCHAAAKSKPAGFVPANLRRTKPEPAWWTKIFSWTSPMT